MTQPTAAPRHRAIIDLDGGVCNDTHRKALAAAARAFVKLSPEYKAAIDAYHGACDADTPYYSMVALVRTLWEAGWHIVLITGRTANHRSKTEQWLRDAGVPYHSLLMRAQHDEKPSVDLKLDWARQYPYVTMVFEDRDKLVDAWRAAGYFCCQTMREAS